MRENESPAKRRSGARNMVWICLIGFLLLLVIAGFFILSRIQDEREQHAEEIQQIQEELQAVKTEKVLLEQLLMQKETEMDQLVTGVVSEHGVQDYRAYLSFDDGPCENTLKVMNILDEYDIKATFFVNGVESELAEEVYRRIVEDGHVLANHTYSHVYKSLYESWDNFYEEIKKLENCVRSQTGYEVEPIVRFPGGSNCGKEAVMREIKGRLDELGYRYFDWNVSGEDAIYSHVPAQDIYRNVVKYVEGKNIAVILLHTTNKTDETVQVLPKIIDYLKQEGYSFHTLDEEDAPTYVVFDQNYK